MDKLSKNRPSVVVREQNKIRVHHVAAQRYEKVLVWLTQQFAMKTIISWSGDDNAIIF